MSDYSTIHFSARQLMFDSVLSTLKSVVFRHDFKRALLWLYTLTNLYIYTTVESAVPDIGAKNVALQLDQ